MFGASKIAIMVQIYFICDCIDNDNTVTFSNYEEIMDLGTNDNDNSFTSKISNLTCINHLTFSCDVHYAIKII